MSFYNLVSQKQVILLNLAGTEIENPILSGLLIKVNLQFQKETHSAVFTVNGTTVALTENANNNFSANLIAGTSPMTTGENVLKFVLTNTQTGEQTLLERICYVQSLPSDAVQVFNISSNSFVNGSLTTQLVCQMCGVRFFQTWFDEFRVKRFGGAKYLSVFDTGSDESSSPKQEVLTIDNQILEKTQYIYLVKHQTQTQEQHDVTFRFRSEQNSANYVDKQVLLTTPACFAFVIKDPFTEA